MRFRSNEDIDDYIIDYIKQLRYPGNRTTFPKKFMRNNSTVINGRLLVLLKFFDDLLCRKIKSCEANTIDALTSLAKAYTLLTDMIKEGKKIKVNDIPGMLSKVKDILLKDTSIICLYVFGNLASGTLKPLSDLDFGVLLSYRLNRMERFRKHLELIGILNGIFKTDEIDLILMNDAPMRFSYNIIKNGRILLCRDNLALVNFRDKIIMQHLDFKYFRDAFDRYFLETVGYYG